MNLDFSKKNFPDNFQFAFIYMKKSQFNPKERHPAQVSIAEAISEPKIS